MDSFPVDNIFIAECLSIPSQFVSIGADGTALLLVPKEWLSLFMTSVVSKEADAKITLELLHAELLNRVCGSFNVTTDSITYLLHHTAADIANRGSDNGSVLLCAHAFVWNRPLLQPCLRGFEHDLDVLPCGSTVSGACCSSSFDHRLLQRESFRQWHQLVQRLNLPFRAANKQHAPSLVSLNKFLQRLCALVLHCPFISLDTFECFVPLVDAGVSSSCRFANKTQNLLSPVAVITCRKNFVIFLYPFRPYTLYHALTYSSRATSKLMLDYDSNGQKHMFIFYQLLMAQSAFHRFGLPFGDIHLSDVFIDEALWLQVRPCFHRVIHKFICNHDENAAMLSIPKLLAPKKQTMSELVAAWCAGALSNYDYLIEINRAAGRELNDPENHYILPWVVDFSQPDGGFRDLYKSKYRLAKGDGQLDLTWNSGFTGDTDMPAHHIPETFSSLTYYIYKARQTPKSVLCKYVRRRFVAEEYPSTMRRLYEWTPDECIPEFYSDSAIFTSMHDDLPELHVPEFCLSVSGFLQWHRQMLESDHVSARLHVWIDLYFGYLLTGEDAVRHKNVYLSMVQQQQNFHHAPHANQQPLTHYGLNKIFERPHPRRMCCGTSATNFTLHYRPWAITVRGDTSWTLDGVRESINAVHAAKSAPAAGSNARARKQSSDAEFNRNQAPPKFSQPRSLSSRRADFSSSDVLGEDERQSLNTLCSSKYEASIDSARSLASFPATSREKCKSVGDIRDAYMGNDGDDGVESRLRLVSISELTDGVDALALDAVYSDSNSAGDAECASLRSTESGGTQVTAGGQQQPVAQPSSSVRDLRNGSSRSSRTADVRSSMTVGQSQQSQLQNKNKSSISDSLDYIRHIERFLKFCHQMEGRDPEALTTHTTLDDSQNLLYRTLFDDMRALTALMLQIVLHKRALANALHVKDAVCEESDVSNIRHLQNLLHSIVGQQQQLPNIVRSNVELLVRLFGVSDEVSDTGADVIPADKLKLLILSTEFLSPLAGINLMAFPFGLAEFHGLIGRYKVDMEAFNDSGLNESTSITLKDAARPYIVMKNLSLRLPGALSRICSFDAGSGMRLVSLVFAQLFRSLNNNNNGNWSHFAFMCLCTVNALTKYYGPERSALLFTRTVESIYQEELVLYADSDVDGRAASKKAIDRKIDLLTKLHGIDFVSMLLVRFGLYVFVKRLLPAIINQIILINFTPSGSSNFDINLAVNDSRKQPENAASFCGVDRESEMFYLDVSNENGENSADDVEKDVYADSYHDWLRTRKERIDQFTSTSCSTLIELASRLGPLVTANYITSSLLKTLSLCYAQSDSLLCMELDELLSSRDGAVNIKKRNGSTNRSLRNQQFVTLLLEKWSGKNGMQRHKRRLALAGDEKCRPIVEALCQCAEMYGEHFIITKYLHYAAELSKVALKQLSPLNAMTEAGMLGVMSLMTRMLPTLTSMTSNFSSITAPGNSGGREKLVDCIDLIASDTLYNTIELVTSSSHLFASSKLRHVLLYKWLDAVVVLCQLLGKRLSREYVTVPLLVRYFNAFSLFCHSSPSGEQQNVAAATFRPSDAADGHAREDFPQRKFSHRSITTTTTPLMQNLIEDLITTRNRSGIATQAEKMFDNAEFSSSANNNSFEENNTDDDPSVLETASHIRPETPSSKTSPATAKSSAAINAQCSEMFTRKLAHDSYVMFTHYLGGYHLQRNLINDSYLHELTIAHADAEAKLHGRAPTQQTNAPRPSSPASVTVQQPSLLISSNACLDVDVDDVEIQDHFARPGADENGDYLSSSVKSNRLSASSRFDDAASPFGAGNRFTMWPPIVANRNTDSRPPTSTRPLPAGSNRLSGNVESRWSGEDKAAEEARRRHYPRVSSETRDGDDDDENEHASALDDADNGNATGLNLISDDDSSIVIVDAAAIADELTASASSARHLQGNWLAYWLHESGRAEPRQSESHGRLNSTTCVPSSYMPMWSVKQMPLQRFSTGQKAPVRSLLPLEAENSFIGGGKDCTMFVYNILNGNNAFLSSASELSSSASEVEPVARFQGAYRKPIFSMRFVERERLVCAAAYDGVVVWDPWSMRAVQSIPMPSVSSIDVTRAPSSTVCVAHSKGDLCWISCVDIRMRASRGGGVVGDSNDTSPFLNIPVSTFRPTVASLGRVRCLACLPDNVRIAVGFSTGIISLIDLRFGFLLASVKAHDSEVLSIDIISQSAANSFMSTSGSIRTNFNHCADDCPSSSDFMLSIGIDGLLAVWCLNLLSNSSSASAPSSTANVTASPYVVYRARLPPQLSDIVACSYDRASSELLCVAAPNRLGVMHNFQTVLMQQYEKQQQQRAFNRSNRAVSTSSTVLSASSALAAPTYLENAMPFSPISLIDSPARNFGYYSVSSASPLVSASSSNTLLASLGSSSSFIGGSGIMAAAVDTQDTMASSVASLDGGAVFNRSVNSFSNNSAINANSVVLDFDVQRLHGELFRDNIVSLAPLSVNKQLLLGGENGSIYLIC